MNHTHHPIFHAHLQKMIENMIEVGLKNQINDSINPAHLKEILLEKTVLQIENSLQMLLKKYILHKKKINDPHHLVLKLQQKTPLTLDQLNTCIEEILPQIITQSILQYEMKQLKQQMKEMLEANIFLLKKTEKSLPPLLHMQTIAENQTQIEDHLPHHSNHEPSPLQPQSVTNFRKKLQEEYDLSKELRNNKEKTLASSQFFYGTTPPNKAAKKNPSKHFKK